MSVENDPEPLVLGLTTEQMPLLVQVRQWTATPYGVRLRRGRVPCRVRIEVDGTSPDQPVVGRSRLADTCGRGLVMVDKLSRKWDVSPLPGGGKTAWAIVSCEQEGWIPCAGNA